MRNYDRINFGIFRIMFGVYLVFYLIRFLQYSTEIYSYKGVIDDFSINWTISLIPNILFYYDEPLYVQIFLVVLIILAIFFTLGIFRRTSAFLLWYGWACLYNRNNLTGDPSLPFIGWLLLACSIIPLGESFSISNKNYTIKKWEIPKILIYGAWIVLGVAYTYSGIEKLGSPSWANGMAMYSIYRGSLAYDNFINTFMLALPLVLIKFQTWTTIFLQITALPFYLYYRTRFIAWTAMVILHILVLLTLDLVQVSLGMFIFHLFVFDYKWIYIKKPGSQTSLLD